MKEYYETYSDNLEIIGIACNDTEVKWREAVKKHQLRWVNLINQGDDINKDVSVMYAVKGYPTKIIINPDGTIQDIFDGEGDDFYSRIEELMAPKR